MTSRCIRKGCLLLLAAVCICTVRVRAQSVIDGLRSRIAFAGSDLRVTGVNGSLGVLSGVRAGFTVHETPTSELVLGGAYFDLVHSISMSSGRGVTDTYLDMQYSGVTLEYSRHVNDQISLTVQSLLGAGYTSLKDQYRRSFESAPFLLLEPSVAVSGSFAPFLRVGVGFSYRLGSPVNMQRFRSLGTGGPSAMITLTIG